MELPEYEVQPVVECYLEPGKPYQLLLQESVPYFNEPSLPLIDDALVVISHAGQHDTLENTFFFDFETEKVYNYVAADSRIPADYGGTFELYIRDGQGREVRATTVLPDTVSVRPLEFRSNDEGRVSVTARWPDFADQTSYYRLAMHRYDPSSEPDVLLTLDDRIGDGDDFVISTFYYLDPEDSIFVDVYHIEEAYWRYLVTTDDAENSNGNPFAQPGVILSNVEGGIGIFTSLSKSRREAMVP